MVSQFILWSTVIIVMGAQDVGVHQVTSTPFANEQACLDGMEILIKGRPEKQVTREDGYVRTSVEIEGATLVNRLQCIPTGFPVTVVDTAKPVKGK